jgi:WD40 repeat protein
LLLAVAGGLGVYSRHVWEEQQVAIAATKLERDGAAALELTRKRPLKGLLLAMRSAEDLQQLMQRKGTSEYLTGSPIYALQQALETTKYQTLLAHPATIRRMVVTPKGDRIITVGGDNAIRTWDIAGNLINCIQINDQSLYPQVSQNGDRIVLSPEPQSGSKTTKVIDLDGRLIKEFHGDETPDITFRPDGYRIFVHEREREYIQSDGGKSWRYKSSTIKIFDDSFNLIAKLHSPSGYSRVDSLFGPYISFSPKGNLFATNPGNRIVEVRDLSGKFVVRLSGATSEITGINFNSIGDKIIASSDDGSARVWNLNGKTVSILKKQTKEERSLDARFSPQNDQIVTTKGRNIRLWSSSGKLMETFRGHQNQVTSAQFNHDGKYVISSSSDGTIKVWNLEGSIVFDSSTPFYSFKYPVLLTSGRVLFEGLDNSAYIWDLSKQISEKKIEKPKFQVDIPVINSSLNRILVLLENSQAELLDVEGNMIAKIKLRDIPEAKYSGISYFTEWHFSRNKKNIIATAYIPGKEGDSIREENSWDLPKPIKLSLFVFDLQGKFIRAIKNSDLTDIESTAYADELYSGDSPPQMDSSGEYMLTSTDAGSADDPGTTSLSMKSGKKLFDFDGKRSHMNPRRNLFLTHNDNSTVKIWNFSGQLVAEFKQNQPYLTDAKFSSNGDRVIMLFKNGNIQTHPIETLPQMLKRSCTWLRTYLAANPAELDQLPTCKAQFAQKP